ncbi:MAG: hypothetical protein KBA33_06125 [Cloacibacterium sp.]|nr:hypothetical protein [Cloacibacterium sp.]
MKKLLFFIFLQSFILVLSQSEIKIIDGDNKNPVAYASVYCKNQLIGKTNAEGILFFKTQCKKIEIKADNFYDEEADVKTKIFVSLTKLDEKSRQIQTVTLKDQSDPRAIDILNKVEKQFKYNSPSSLDSYMFTSYHKYSVDLDKDSIKAYSYYLNKRIDSLKNLPQKNLILKEKKIKDSIENQQIDLMMKESQLMLWETAKEHLYSQKYGEKINVLDNRISGFKDPIYELMSFRSNLNKIPKEINFENRDLYRFFLTDTIDIDGRKTLVIKFRELDKKSTNNRRKFTGFIYIDQATYGIAKIESNSKKLNEGNITSTWKYMYGKWFLASENLKIRIGNTSFKEQNPNTSEKEKPIVKKKFGQYFYMNSLYSGHQSPIPTSSEDFKGYTLSVKNTDGSLLEKYRPNPLSEREQNTYVKIDSLGNSKNFDRKVNFITSLIKGKLRFGKIDYDPLKSFHWNAHEGIRLGINAKLNEKFHSYISPDAYIGYGFSDKKWKYGIGIDV